MTLRVTEVASSGDKDAFLRVPHLVFAHDRNWVAPLDLERTYGLTEGNIFHGDLRLEQLFFMRPVPGWSRVSL